MNLRYFSTLLLTLACVQASFAVLIDGYCYLEGESDYTGTQVKFIKVSPSALTDSAYTESTGYFDIDLQPGIYDVEFSHESYATTTLADQVLVTPTTLPPVTLIYTILSGVLSDTVGPGVYRIVGNISVDSGDSLHLMPGTIFLFNGPYSFEIEGTLLAEGTQSDSIIFTTDTFENPDLWRSLYFHASASSGSRLAYCVVQYASRPALNGGGVQCIGSSPSFSHCTIESNAATYGGGVYLNWDSSPTFTACVVRGNSADLGGGIYCGHDSSPIFVCCIIHGNSADLGGGVYCDEAAPVFAYCTLCGNSANWNGDGVYSLNSSSSFNSSIIAFSGGEEFYFQSSSGSRIAYCDVYGNNGENFAFYNGDSLQGPVGIGLISTMNANADSCDTYGNIFLDPMLEDVASGDFRLTDYSRCIGAGDPVNSPEFDIEENPRPDPPGSNPDIGAYENSRGFPLDLGVSLKVQAMPTVYSLHPNWPNPFNSATTIRYDVKQVGLVQLTIFNLLGGKVMTLVDGRHLAGSYTVVWDATGIPSGIYLCRMEASGFMQTRKLMLLK